VASEAVELFGLGFVAGAITTVGGGVAGWLSSLGACRTAPNVRTATVRARSSRNEPSPSAITGRTAASSVAGAPGVKGVVDCEYPRCPVGHPPHCHPSDVAESSDPGQDQKDKQPLHWEPEKIAVVPEDENPLFRG